MNSPQIHITDIFTGTLTNGQTYQERTTWFNGDHVLHGIQQMRNSDKEILYTYYMHIGRSIGLEEKYPSFDTSYGNLSREHIDESDRIIFHIT